MTLKIMVNDLHFNTNRVSQDACVMRIWWSSHVAHNCDEWFRGQATFLKTLSQMAKLTSKVKVNDPHSWYLLRVSHDACSMQILCFQLKFVTNKITDGRRDRQR